MFLFIDTAQICDRLWSSDFGSICLQVVAHSMGAWVAYELLIHARASGVAMPVKTFLSAMPHPAIPFYQRPWRQQATLNEPQFQVLKFA